MLVVRRPVRHRRAHRRVRADRLPRAARPRRRPGPTVVVIAGNHDNDRRLQAVAPLLELGRVVTRPAFAGPTRRRGRGRRAATARERAGRRSCRSCRSAASSRPTSSCAARPPTPLPAYADRYAPARCDSLTGGFRPDTVNVVAAHCMVHGGDDGGSERAATPSSSYSRQRHRVPGRVPLRRPRPPAPPAGDRRARARSATPARRCSSTSARPARRRSACVVEAPPGTPGDRRRRCRSPSGRPLVRAGRHAAELDGSPPAAVDDRALPQGAACARSSASGWPTRCARCSPSAVDVVVEAAADGGRAPVGARARPSGRSPHELFAAYLADAGVDDARLARAVRRAARGGRARVRPVDACELEGFSAVPRPHGRDRLRGRRPVRPRRARPASARPRSSTPSCFALYGIVPRYDDQQAGRARHQPGPATRRGCGSTSPSAAESYTAVRVVRRTKGGGATTKEARLEGPDGDVLAGNADEVTAEVDELLGLSFEHFTRCVVLPQGEFARFLHDKPPTARTCSSAARPRRLRPDGRACRASAPATRSSRSPTSTGRLDELAGAGEEGVAEAAAPGRHAGLAARHRRRRARPASTTLARQEAEQRQVAEHGPSRGRRCSRRSPCPPTSPASPRPQAAAGEALADGRDALRRAEAARPRRRSRAADLADRAQRPGRRRRDRRARRRSRGRRDHGRRASVADAREAHGRGRASARRADRGLAEARTDGDRAAAARTGPMRCARRPRGRRALPGVRAAGRRPARATAHRPTSTPAASRAADAAEAAGRPPSERRAEARPSSPGSRPRSADVAEHDRRSRPSRRRRASGRRGRPAGSRRRRPPP